MGITIKCKKTGREYDMGYCNFMALRNKVAVLCSPEFGEHYSKVTDALYLRTDKEKQKFFEEFDRRTQELITSHAVSEKVADFCLQPDCKGAIRYGTCKEIYNHIKDCKDSYTYGYAGRRNAMTIMDFADLLLECYENKSMLLWE